MFYFIIRRSILSIFTLFLVSILLFSFRNIFDQNPTEDYIKTLNTKQLTYAQVERLYIKQNKRLV